MNTLGHFIWQTWRSIVAFFLTFIVLGVMAWFTPDWLLGFLEVAESLKIVVIDGANTMLGYGQPSALFSILVGDTAIALALLWLFTRVVVLTLILRLGGTIYRGLFGRSSGD